MAQVGNLGFSNNTINEQSYKHSLQIALTGLFLPLLAGLTGFPLASAVFLPSDAKGSVQVFSWVAGW